MLEDIGGTASLFSDLIANFLLQKVRSAPPGECSTQETRSGQDGFWILQRALAEPLGSSRVIYQKSCDPPEGPSRIFEVFRWRKQNPLGSSRVLYQNPHDPSEGSSRTLTILKRALAEPLGSSSVIFENPGEPPEGFRRTIEIIQSVLSEPVRSSRGL